MPLSDPFFFRMAMSCNGVLNFRQIIIHLQNMSSKNSDSFITSDRHRPRPQTSQTVSNRPDIGVVREQLETTENNFGKLVTVWDGFGRGR